MNNNIESYCRPRRSYSISPSVSFDNIPNLTEEERKEKTFYGAAVKDMVNEIFLAFDDIVKHINHCLVTNVRSILKGDMSSDEIETVITPLLTINSLTTNSLTQHLKNSLIALIKQKLKAKSSFHLKK